MKHDYILLDRSGSMADKWVETLSGVNAYVATLAANAPTADTRVTLAAFDWQQALCFDVVREGIAATEWNAVEQKELSPRGYTPLYDAIGRLVNVANADNPDNCAIIIVTDGQENQSKEVKREQAQKLLDACRAKNWRVVFLGADFDNFAQASSVGNQFGQTISASAANLRGTFTATASNRASYAVNSMDAMDYTVDQRAAAQQAFDQDMKEALEKAKQKQK